MIHKLSTTVSDNILQAETSSNLDYIDIIINDTLRFELSKGDEDFNIKNGDVAFEIEKDEAISIARSILFAYDAL